MSDQKPKVVAMVLAYNTADLLEKAIDKIPKGPVVGIFVMDDGSARAGLHNSPVFPVLPVSSSRPA